jgi:peroxiredoxin
LVDFQSRISDFNQRNVKLLAASVDQIEDAEKTIERHKLSFPVAYGLSAREFSERTGAFFDGEKAYLQATGFLIAPDGNVALAVYSSGAIGRLTAADTLGMIDYFMKVKAK